MGIEFIECYTPPKDVVTCSVKLDFSELADYNSEGVIFRVAFAEFGNNGIRIADRTYYDNFPTEITLENVVMNSAMYMASKLPIAPRYDVDTDAFTLAQYERGAFCLSPEAEDVTIQLYYDSSEGADALPDQVEEGVKFVGANGVVEEGTLPYYDGTDMDANVYDSNDEYAYIQSSVDKTSIIEDVVYSKVPLSEFGDATAADVRTGVKFTSAEGLNKEGTMPNNGAVNYKANFSNFACKLTIPEGYHNGEGIVSWTLEEKTVTPNESLQTIAPTSADFLSIVKVNPIPDKYKDTSNVNVTPADVLSGKVIIDKDGNETVGTMPTVGIGKPVITTTVYDEDNEIAIKATANQSKGYVSGTFQPYVETYATLTLDGNKVTMSCAGAKIERTVGASIETCNVYIDVIDTVGNIGVTASTFADGEISVVNIAAKTNGEQTLISNVVCGSVITLVCNNYFSVVWAHGHNQVRGTSSVCLTAPRTSGNYIAEIIAYDD